jgi:sterol 24-C-methyltransferase
VHQRHELGIADHFHFSRLFADELVTNSIARHEHYLSSQLELRPGMKVLDIGCGLGGAAREIARFFSNVTVVGVNNDRFQVSCFDDPWYFHM